MTLYHLDLDKNYIYLILNNKNYKKINRSLIYTNKVVDIESINFVTYQIKGW